MSIAPGSGDAPAPRLVLASNAHAGPAEGTGGASNTETRTETRED